LVAAKSAYEAVDSHHGRNFLLLFRAHQMNITGYQLTVFYNVTIRSSANIFSALLHLEARAEETLISELRSLVALEPDMDGDS
jgi:hypothetical protein